MTKRSIPNIIKQLRESLVCTTNLHLRHNPFMTWLYRIDGFYY